MFNYRRQDPHAVVDLNFVFKAMLNARGFTTGEIERIYEIEIKEMPEFYTIVDGKLVRDFMLDDMALIIKFEMMTEKWRQFP